MKKDPPEPRGNYRSLYYKNNREMPYTSTQMPEDDYLQTDVWKKIRFERLKMDYFQCQICGTAKNLRVHHIYYPDVWGTENIETDLVTLCDECHQLVHARDTSQNKGE